MYFDIWYDIYDILITFLPLDIKILSFWFMFSLKWSKEKKNQTVDLILPVLPEFTCMYVFKTSTEISSFIRKKQI